MTHEELAALLAVRVHNTLLQLTREGTLRRQRRCQRGGVSLEPQVIEAIFERYELDKKRAP